LMQHYFISVSVYFNVMKYFSLRIKELIQKLIQA